MRNTFTGIVEEIGILKNVKKGKKSSVLVIGAKKVLEGTQIGDSIAMNGVCLTVTSMTDTSYEADVMSETLSRTNLGELKAGDPLNLERALTFQSRLGGHIVSGHIDGTGVITGVKQDDNAIWITISTSKEVLKYIIEKGSIAIDGVSLTVAKLGEDSFSISMIPHTKDVTILGGKKAGATVNLECDCIGKYVERLLGFATKETKKETKITSDFLAEHGFM